MLNDKVLVIQINGRDSTPITLSMTTKNGDTQTDANVLIKIATQEAKNGDVRGILKFCHCH